MTAATAGPHVRPEWFGYVVLAAGFMMHLVLGSMYTWGNFTTYLTSYLRRDHPSIEYSDTLFTYLTVAAGQSFSMPFTGWLQIRHGSRISSLLGAIVVGTGVFLSRWSIQSGVPAFTVTYGVMFGIGIGLVYAAPMAVALTYLPKRRGMINGVIVMGFGLGAFCFNFLVTGYLNPHDCKPVCPGDGATYPDFTCPGWLPYPNVTAAPSFLGELSCDNKYFPPESSVPSGVPDLLTLLSIIYYTVILTGAMFMVPQGSPLTPFSGTAAAYTAVEEETVPGGDTLPEDQRGVQVQQQRGGGEAQQQQQQQAEPVEREMKTVEVVRTLLGWQLCVGFCLTTMGGGFVLAQYKTYGQKFSWSTDAGEGRIASAMSLGNAFGRIVHGAAADRFGFAETLVFSAAASTALQATISFTHSNEYFFAVWCVAITFFYGSSFALYPTGAMRLFGRKHFPSTFGFIIGGFGVGALVLAFVNKALVDSLGFPGMTKITAGVTFVGMLNAASIAWQERKIFGSHATTSQVMDGDGDGASSDNDHFLP